ncbi:PAAR motif protein [Caballeronia sp. SBC1]|uniref:PAAR domain-containing protein n=2 Tax=unclassified Caballeronia TaxID=2646786 RepID=UPI0013E1A5FE|nr:PAAR domain-containing protein [Caballeronia sp. SBC1]QIE25474.1 PAAR motif protein [Caballeronia sp. SBC2]QIN63524.1 PAAR motif protein [Caballeronia sp. SBC1]
MRRYNIKLHDKTTSGAFVTDGEPTTMHHGTPLAFIGAAIYCPTCKSAGVIVASGPRLSVSFRGKQAALENDLGMCKCSPTPRLIASQSAMSQSLDGNALTRQGYTPMGVPFLRHHDEQITLRDRGTRRVLANIQYRLKDSSGIIASGKTDANGRTERIATDIAEHLIIEIAPAH